MANDSSKNEKFKKSSDSGSGYGGYYYYDEGNSYLYGEGGGSGSPQKGIKDYLVILRERVWYILIGFLLVFSLAIVVTINQTAIYRATATVQILRKEATIVRATHETGQENVILGMEDFNTQVQILNSVRLAERVEARITGDERIRFMAPYERGGAGDPLTPIEVLLRNRSISPLRMSFVVAIQYSHPDKEMAARIANFFAEEFIDHNLQIRISESMVAVEELKLRAEQQRQEVERIENQIQAYRVKMGTVSLDANRDVATERLRALNMQEAELGAQFSDIETAYLTLQRIRETGRSLTDFAPIASQPLVSELMSTRANQRIAVAQLSERYRERHPQMIQARNALQQSEQELAAAVESAASKIVTSYESTQRNLAEVRRAMAEQEAELLRLRGLAVEFETMERESQVQQGIYMYLVGRMRDTTIASTIESPSARLVDRAAPPFKPASPNIPLNLAVGVLGGLGLGFGVAFFVAFIDDRVKTAFDIENVLGLTLLGIIPEIKKLTPIEKAKIAFNEKDKQVAEAFRTLHSSLKLNNESKFAQAILVTSSVPGEGKSFTSTNLALTLAGHGERTLIVDCDLRMPNIHKSLELENKKGVIDVCLNDTPLEEVILKDVVPNCDVLTTGGRAKNPTQILSSKSFERMVAELRKRYDRIVFDTPPLAAVSDAMIILPLVDGILFTIKFNKVKRSAARHNARRLLESNVPVFGAVLNNLSLSVSGYYYAQYYDKSYYDYYTPTSKKAQAEAGELR
jgi:polysaccharide biosynthesis transport protein